MKFRPTFDVDVAFKHLGRSRLGYIAPMEGRIEELEVGDGAKKGSSRNAKMLDTYAVIKELRTGALAWFIWRLNATAL